MTIKAPLIGVSDLHVPYYDVDLVNAIPRLGQRLGIDRLGIFGDMIEMFDLSRFDKRALNQAADTKVSVEFQAAGRILRVLELVDSKLTRSRVCNREANR